jgi:hypothetical protein
MIDKKAIEKNFYHFHLCVDKQQQKEFFNVYLQIDALIDENKKVPASLLKKFGGFFQDAKKIYRPELNKTVETKIEQVLTRYRERFEKQPEFLFAFSVETKADDDWLEEPPGISNGNKNSKTRGKIKTDDTKYVVSYDYEKFIRKSVSEYIYSFEANNDQQNDKKRSVQFFYGSLTKYLNKWTNNEQKGWKKYKPGIIAGCIAMWVTETAFAEQVRPNKQFSNEDMFGAVKQFIKNLPPQKNKQFSNALLQMIRNTMFNLSAKTNS